MRARLGGIVGGKLAQPLGEFITPLIPVEGLRTGQLIRPKTRTHELWLSAYLKNAGRTPQRTSRPAGPSEGFGGLAFH
jgi:hypothetical protein